MKQLLYLYIISNLLTACSPKEEKKPEKVYSNNEVSELNYSYSPIFKKNRHTTSKILLIEYWRNGWSESKFDNIRELIDTSAIQDFLILLKKNYNDRYCCCPETAFNLMFYDGNNKFHSYEIEDLDSTESVLVFDRSYQYSYQIPREQWSLFLDKFDNANSRDFFIGNLNTSKAVLNYINKNNLPFFQNDNRSSKWDEFEGEFKFTASRIGKEELKESEITNNIKTAYPNEFCDIDFSNYHRQCGSYDGSDCITERTVTVSCSEGFYNQFDIYGPKSYYNKLYADIIVVGSIEQLNNIDSLSKKK